MPSNRFYPSECDRHDTGSMPCAGGACPAPGSRPTFLSLAPMYALRRRARMTGRLPHGRLRKPIESCYRLTPDSRWEESLPWRPARLCAEFNHDQNVLGQFYRKSQFRTLTRCGALQTRQACKCGDVDVDVCVALDEKQACKLCPTPVCPPDLCDLYSLRQCTPLPCRCDCDPCQCNPCRCAGACQCNPCRCAVACQCCAAACQCACDPCECDPCLCTGQQLSESQCDCGRSSDNDGGDGRDGGDECHRKRYPDAQACDSDLCLDCPPLDNPCDRINARNRAWYEQRHAFKPSRALAGNPSGRIEPIGERMRGVRPLVATSRVSRRFKPRQASHKFVGSRNPEAFCNSLRCRFAGSNGPKELRAAICQIGPQSRGSGAGCGC